MLRYLIGLCFLWSSVHTTFAQGIKFEKGTWETVLAKAQEENKPIFVDAYTTWCGPCKWMAKEIFTQETVASYVNAHFVAYKMDMEKGEGPAFAIANKVNAFPTLLYFDSQGLLLHKAAGARNAEQLIQLCEDAMDPSKQVGSYHEKYKDGVRDADFLKQYVNVLAETGEDFAEPFELYWNTLKEEERHSEDLLNMLAVVTEDFSDIESDWTTYFMENRTAYAKNVGADIVDYYMLEAYTYHTYHLAQLEDNEETKSKVEKLLTLVPEAQKEFKPRWNFYRAALETPPNMSKVQRLRKGYLKTTIDMEELNEIAWAIYTEGEGSKKELKEALGYITRSVETSPHYYNLHIQAMILKQLGKNKTALDAAQKAIVSAEEMGLNKEQTQETLGLLKTLKKITE
ncbi:MAG: thioredoxin family protein [Aureispira sp.]